MSGLTFSRKGRQLAASPATKPASATKRGAPRSDPFDALAESPPPGESSFLFDASDPFFFGPDKPHEQPERRGGGKDPAAAKSPGSKGGRQAAAAQAAAAAPVRSPARPRKSEAAAPGEGAAAAGGKQKQAAAAAAGASRSSPRKAAAAVAVTAAAAPKPQPKPQAKGQAKQHPPVKPAASLLSQRNQAGSAARQQQHPEAEGREESTAAAAAGARKPPTSGRGRPSVRSRPAAAADAAQPSSPPQQQRAAPATAAAAGVSPGKRKAPAPAKATPGSQAAPAAATEGSPSKRMKANSGKGAAAPVGPGQPGGAAGAAAGGPARASGGAGRRAPASGGAGGGVMAALNPAALREQAAATTVVQAQALGEQQSITDDALWALDGLTSKNDATARESLAALVEICATRRGRLALRSGQLAADVLEAAGSLRIASDPVQALGVATLLLCFCQADADAALLGRADVAAAAAALLRLPASHDAASAHAPGVGSGAAAKLAAVLRERPYSLQLPPEERGSAQAVALVALADVLDPSKSALHADPLKHALREAGALEAAAQVAADHAGSLSDASPTMQTVRSLWRLHKALHLLESACFACPDNEARLLGARVTTGIPPMVANPGFVGWLVQQLGVLSRQPLISGIKKDCLRALLAVLLNATQNNPAGCEAVVAAGVVEPAAAVLAQLVRGGPKMKGVVAGEGELTAWHDVLSTCIALFINLAEHRASWRQQLRDLSLPDPRPAGPAAAAGRVQLVPLLCSLLAVVAAPPGKAGETPRAASAGGGMGRRASLGTGEISADCLAQRDDRDVQSMAEVYAAVLLGFLIQDCPEAQEQAAALLPGRSLEGVTAAVGRALDFYATMGAMTQQNVDSLRGLLASLQQAHQQEQQPSGDQTAGAGAGAGGGSPSPSGSPMSPVLG